MATTASVNSFNSRHSITKRRQTLRMPVPLSRRKSAMVLKSGARAAGQPHELDVALCLALQPSTRLDPVQVPVDVDLQQDRRVVRRPAGRCRLRTFEPELLQIELF